jgi:hypothetical protein
MKKTIAAILMLCSLALAAPVQKPENPDFTTMEQILGVATQNLSGKGYRVVFASEDNRESLQLRHWIVTVQKYPAGYKTEDDSRMGIVFSGPPCALGKALEFCSINEVPGEPLFRGRFDIDDANSHFRRFEGNIVGTAVKMSAFNKQINANQQWTQAEIAAALAAAGAKFGPDKEKEFRATLPGTLKMLEKAFGPMRVNKVISMKPSFLTLPSKEPALFGWPAYWSVSTILLRNRKERLVMYFDPFEGQLQSLYVSQGSTVLDPKTHKPKWKPPND